MVVWLVLGLMPSQLSGFVQAAKKKTCNAVCRTVYLIPSHTQYKPMTRETEAQLEKMRLELRRGVLVLAILGQLRREHYGYSLRQVLSQGGLDIEEGTLYPLIRRLEANGLLTSRWSEASGRKRRYYSLSAVGQDVFQRLRVEWESLSKAINSNVEETS